MGRQAAKKQQDVLTTLSGNDLAERTTEDDNALGHVLDYIQNIERQVEERIAEIKNAAEDSIASLRNAMKTKMVRLPKATREMKMKDFREKYPEDFKTGALKEIQRKFEDRAQEMDKAILASSSSGKEKRAAEPATVMRTVRARKTRGGSAVAEEGKNTFLSGHEFNGVPLQTPMPFAGQAVAMPVTMLMQNKKGGRTKASRAPSAAVVTTKDGKQWALGADGLESIPASHRAEVADLLSSQFSFLASALGKQISS